MSYFFLAEVIDYSLFTEHKQTKIDKSIELEKLWFPNLNEFRKEIKKAFFLQVLPLRRISTRKFNLNNNALLKSFSQNLLNENLETKKIVLIDLNLSYDQTAKLFFKSINNTLQKNKSY